MQATYILKLLIWTIIFNDEITYMLAFLIESVKFKELVLLLVIII